MLDQVTPRAGSLPLAATALPAGERQVPDPTRDTPARTYAGRNVAHRRARRWGTVGPRSASRMLSMRVLTAVISCGCWGFPRSRGKAVIPVARNESQHVDGGSPAAAVRRLINEPGVAAQGSTGSRSGRSRRSRYRAAMITLTGDPRLRAPSTAAAGLVADWPAAPLRARPFVSRSCPRSTSSAATAGPAGGRRAVRPHHQLGAVRGAGGSRSFSRGSQSG